MQGQVSCFDRFSDVSGFDLSGRLRFSAETVGAVTAAGLAAVAAAQVVGLGEDEIGAVVIELAGLRDEGFGCIGFGVGSHALFSPISVQACSRSGIGRMLF
jgi:hypothetical protein